MAEFKNQCHPNEFRSDEGVGGICINNTNIDIGYTSDIDNVDRVIAEKCVVDELNPDITELPDEYQEMQIELYQRLCGKKDTETDGTSNQVTGRCMVEQSDGSGKKIAGKTNKKDDCEAQSISVEPEDGNGQDLSAYCIIDGRIDLRNTLTKETCQKKTGVWIDSLNTLKCSGDDIISDSSRTEENCNCDDNPGIRDEDCDREWDTTNNICLKKNKRISNTKEECEVVSKTLTEYTPYQCLDIDDPRRSNQSVYPDKVLEAHYGSIVDGNLNLYNESVTDAIRDRFPQLNSNLDGVAEYNTYKQKLKEIDGYSQDVKDTCESKRGYWMGPSYTRSTNFGKCERFSPSGRGWVPPYFESQAGGWGHGETSVPFGRGTLIAGTNTIYGYCPQQRVNHLERHWEFFPIDHGTAGAHRRRDVGYYGAGVWYHQKALFWQVVNVSWWQNRDEVTRAMYPIRVTEATSGPSALRARVVWLKEDWHGNAERWYEDHISSGVPSGQRAANGLLYREGHVNYWFRGNEPVSQMTGMSYENCSRGAFGAATDKSPQYIQHASTVASGDNFFDTFATENQNILNINNQSARPPSTAHMKQRTAPSVHRWVSKYPNSNPHQRSLFSRCLKPIVGFSDDGHEYPTFRDPRSYIYSTGWNPDSYHTETQYATEAECEKPFGTYKSIPICDIKDNWINNIYNTYTASLLPYAKFSGLSDSEIPILEGKTDEEKNNILDFNVTLEEGDSDLIDYRDFYEKKRELQSYALSDISMTENVINNKIDTLKQSQGNFFTKNQCLKAGVPVWRDGHCDQNGTIVNISKNECEQQIGEWVEVTTDGSSPTIPKKCKKITWDDGRSVTTGLDENGETTISSKPIVTQVNLDTRVNTEDDINWYNANDILYHDCSDPPGEWISMCEASDKCKTERLDENVDNCSVGEDECPSGCVINLGNAECNFPYDPTKAAPCLTGACYNPDEVELYGADGMTSLTREDCLNVGICSQDGLDLELNREECYSRSDTSFVPNNQWLINKSVEIDWANQPITNEQKCIQHDLGQPLGECLLRNAVPEEDDPSRGPLSSLVNEVACCGPDGSLCDESSGGRLLWSPNSIWTSTEDIDENPHDLPEELLPGRLEMVSKCREKVKETNIDTGLEENTRFGSCLGNCMNKNISKTKCESKGHCSDGVSLDAENCLYRDGDLSDDSNRAGKCIVDGVESSDNTENDCTNAGGEWLLNEWISGMWTPYEWKDISQRTNCPGGCEYGICVRSIPTATDRIEGIDTHGWIVGANIYHAGDSDSPLGGDIDEEVTNQRDCELKYATPEFLDNNGTDYRSPWLSYRTSENDKLEWMENEEAYRDAVERGGTTIELHRPKCELYNPTQYGLKRGGNLIGTGGVRLNPNGPWINEGYQGREKVPDGCSLDGGGVANLIYPSKAKCSGLIEKRDNICAPLISDNKKCLTHNLATHVGVLINDGFPIIVPRDILSGEDIYDPFSSVRPLRDMTQQQQNRWVLSNMVDNLRNTDALREAIDAIDSSETIPEHIVRAELPENPTVKLMRQKIFLNVDHVTGQEVLRVRHRSENSMRRFHQALDDGEYNRRRGDECYPGCWTCAEENNPEACSSCWNGTDIVDEDEDGYGHCLDITAINLETGEGTLTMSDQLAEDMGLEQVNQAEIVTLPVQEIVPNELTTQRVSGSNIITDFMIIRPDMYQPGAGYYYAISSFDIGDPKKPRLFYDAMDTGLDCDYGRWVHIKVYRLPFTEWEGPDGEEIRVSVGTIDQAARDRGWEQIFNKEVWSVAFANLPESITDESIKNKYNPIIPTYHIVTGEQSINTSIYESYLLEKTTGPLVGSSEKGFLFSQVFGGRLNDSFYPPISTDLFRNTMFSNKRYIAISDIRSTITDTVNKDDNSCKCISDFTGDESSCDSEDCVYLKAHDGKCGSIYESKPSGRCINDPSRPSQETCGYCTTFTPNKQDCEGDGVCVGDESIDDISNCESSCGIYPGTAGGGGSPAIYQYKTNNGDLINTEDEYSCWNGGLDDPFEACDDDLKNEFNSNTCDSEIYGTCENYDGEIDHYSRTKQQCISGNNACFTQNYNLLSDSNVKITHWSLGEPHQNDSPHNFGMKRGHLKWYREGGEAYLDGKNTSGRIAPNQRAANEVGEYRAADREDAVDTSDSDNLRTPNPILGIIEPLGPQANNYIFDLATCRLDCEMDPQCTGFSYVNDPNIAAADAGLATAIYPPFVSGNTPQEKEGAHRSNFKCYIYTKPLEMIGDGRQGTGDASGSFTPDTNPPWNNNTPGITPLDADTIYDNLFDYNYINIENDPEDGVVGESYIKSQTNQELVENNYYDENSCESTCNDIYTYSHDGYWNKGDDWRLLRRGVQDSQNYRNTFEIRRGGINQWWREESFDASDDYTYDNCKSKCDINSQCVGFSFKENVSCDTYFNTEIEKVNYDDIERNPQTGEIQYSSNETNPLDSGNQLNNYHYKTNGKCWNGETGAEVETINGKPADIVSCYEGDAETESDVAQHSWIFNEDVAEYVTNGLPGGSQRELGNETIYSGPKNKIFTDDGRKSYYKIKCYGSGTVESPKRWMGNSFKNKEWIQNTWNSSDEITGNTCSSLDNNREQCIDNQCYFKDDNTNNNCSLYNKDKNNCENHNCKYEESSSEPTSTVSQCDLYTQSTLTIDDPDNPGEQIVVPNLDNPTHVSKCPVHIGCVLDSEPATCTNCENNLKSDGYGNSESTCEDCLLLHKDPTTGELFPNEINDESNDSTVSKYDENTKSCVCPQQMTWRPTQVCSTYEPDHPESDRVTGYVHRTRNANNLIYTEEECTSIGGQFTIYDKFNSSNNLGTACDTTQCSQNESGYPGNNLLRVPKCVTPSDGRIVNEAGMRFQFDRENPDNPIENQQGSCEFEYKTNVDSRSDDLDDRGTNRYDCPSDCIYTEKCRGDHYYLTRRVGSNINFEIRQCDDIIGRHIDSRYECDDNNVINEAEPPVTNTHFSSQEYKCRNGYTKTNGNVGGVQTDKCELSNYNREHIEIIPNMYELNYYEEKNRRKIIKMTLYRENQNDLEINIKNLRKKNFNREYLNLTEAYKIITGSNILYEKYLTEDDRSSGRSYQLQAGQNISEELLRDELDISVDYLINYLVNHAQVAKMRNNSCSPTNSTDDHFTCSLSDTQNPNDDSACPAGCDVTPNSYYTVDANGRKTYSDWIHTLDRQYTSGSTIFSDRFFNVAGQPEPVYYFDPKTYGAISCPERTIYPNTDSNKWYLDEINSVDDDDGNFKCIKRKTINECDDDEYFQDNSLIDTFDNDCYRLGSDGIQSERCQTGEGNINNEDFQEDLTRHINDLDGLNTILMGEYSCDGSFSCDINMQARKRVNVIDENVSFCETLNIDQTECDNNDYCKYESDQARCIPDINNMCQSLDDKCSYSQMVDNNVCDGFFKNECFVDQSKLSTNPDICNPSILSINPTFDKTLSTCQYTLSSDGQIPIVKNDCCETDCISAEGIRVDEGGIVYTITGEVCPKTCGVESESYLSSATCSGTSDSIPETCSGDLPQGQCNVSSQCFITNPDDVTEQIVFTRGGNTITNEDSCGECQIRNESTLEEQCGDSGTTWVPQVCNRPSNVSSDLPETISATTATDEDSCGVCMHDETHRLLERINVTDCEQNPGIARGVWTETGTCQGDPSILDQVECETSEHTWNVEGSCNISTLTTLEDCTEIVTGVWTPYDLANSACVSVNEAITNSVDCLAHDPAGDWTPHTMQPSSCPEGCSEGTDGVCALPEGDQCQNFYDITSSCPVGCTYTAASYPECAFDADQNCPDGCTRQDERQVSCLMIQPTCQNQDEEDCAGFDPTAEDPSSTCPAECIYRSTQNDSSMCPNACQQLDSIFTQEEADIPHDIIPNPLCITIIDETECNLHSNCNWNSDGDQPVCENRVYLNTGNCNTNTSSGLCIGYNSVDNIENDHKIITHNIERVPITSQDDCIIDQIDPQYMAFNDVSWIMNDADLTTLGSTATLNDIYDFQCDNIPGDQCPSEINIDGLEMCTEIQGGCKLTDNECPPRKYRQIRSSGNLSCSICTTSQLPNDYINTDRIKADYIDCSNNGAEFSGPQCNGGQDAGGRRCQLNMNQTGCLDASGDCSYQPAVNNVVPPEDGIILPGGCESGFYVSNTDNPRGCVPCEPIVNSMGPITCRNQNDSLLDKGAGARCADGYKLSGPNRDKDNDTCEQITCDSILNSSSESDTILNNTYNIQEAQLSLRNFNVSATCNNNYHNSNTADDSATVTPCSSVSTGYTLSGCEPNQCQALKGNAEATIGYDYDKVFETLDINTFEIKGIQCDTKMGYESICTHRDTYEVIEEINNQEECEDITSDLLGNYGVWGPNPEPCSVHGGNYTLHGCRPIICTNPDDTDPIFDEIQPAIVNELDRTQGFDVSVVCLENLPGCEPKQDGTDYTSDEWNNLKAECNGLTETECEVDDQCIFSENIASSGSPTAIPCKTSGTPWTVAKNSCLPNPANPTESASEDRGDNILKNTWETMSYEQQLSHFNIHGASFLNNAGMICINETGEKLDSVTRQSCIDDGGSWVSATNEVVVVNTGDIQINEPCSGVADTITGCSFKNDDGTTNHVSCPLDDITDQCISPLTDITDELNCGSCQNNAITEATSENCGACSNTDHTTKTDCEADLTCPDSSGSTGFPCVWTSEWTSKIWNPDDLSCSELVSEIITETECISPNIWIAYTDEEKCNNTDCIYGDYTPECELNDDGLCPAGCDANESDQTISLITSMCINPDTGNSDSGVIDAGMCSPIGSNQACLDTTDEVECLLIKDIGDDGVETDACRYLVGGVINCADTSLSVAESGGCPANCVLSTCTGLKSDGESCEFVQDSDGVYSCPDECDLTGVTGGDDDIILDEDVFDSEVFDEQTSVTTFEREVVGVEGDTVTVSGTMVFSGLVPNEGTLEYDILVDDLKTDISLATGVNYDNVSITSLSNLIERFINFPLIEGADPTELPPGVDIDGEMAVEYEIEVEADENGEIANLAELRQLLQNYDYPNSGRQVKTVIIVKKESDDSNLYLIIGGVGVLVVSIVIIVAMVASSSGKKK